MAVQLITVVHNYIGLSIDTKPTSGVRIGSYFFETDTGLTFRLHLGEQWHNDNTATLSIGRYQAENTALINLMEQVLLELKAANEANGIEVT